MRPTCRSKKTKKTGGACTELNSCSMLPQSASALQKIPQKCVIRDQYAYPKKTYKGGASAELHTHSVMPYALLTKQTKEPYKPIQRGRERMSLCRTEFTLTKTASALGKSNTVRR